MLSLVLPTPEVVRSYVERFDAEQSVVESALSKLFGTFPGNRCPEDVLLKVVTLNSLCKFL